MVDQVQATVAEDAIRLLRAATPERIGEVERLITLAGFHEASDGPGFKFENVFGQVMFSNRSIMQVYLISFLAWRTLQAYSGLIIYLLYKGLPLDVNHASSLPGQAAADEAVNKLASSLAAIRQAYSTLDVPWPAEVPPPAIERHADAEHQAAQEISLLALAYILMHEIHHIALAQINEATGDWAEEHKCDEFARQMLLRDVDSYSASCGDDRDMVRNKRAMAIALANVIYAEITPKRLWAGSDHPPIADRLLANYKEWPTDPNGHAWIYMSSALIAQLRRRGVPIGQIEFKTARELCEKLTELTR